MVKTAVPLAILAAALLGACAGPRTSERTAAAPAAQPVTYQAGTGVVQSASPAPTLASAGASTPSGAALQRLAIRMDDGRMAYVDTSSREFPVGTRVRLTPDRMIERQ